MERQDNNMRPDEDGWGEAPRRQDPDPRPNRREQDRRPRQPEAPAADEGGWDGDGAWDGAAGWNDDAGWDDSFYEPSAPRQYRASRKPGKAAPRANAPRRPRQGRHGQAPAAAVQGESQGLAAYSQEIMLLIAVLLAFVSVIAGIGSCTSPAAETSSDQQQEEQAQQLSPAAERVASAETSVDDNGIVHGTTAEGTKFTIHDAGMAGRQQDKVSFAAAGDQIATDYALELADAWQGEAGDGEYDFKPFYKEVKPFLQDYDLRYMNQETTLIGGQDGWEVAGYPTFVSPDSCADAIADTGFNLVSFTTNHSYDAGAEGIEYSQTVWDRYPQIIVGGSFRDQDDRETVQLIERNGIRFAFLSYCYGDNSYEDASSETNGYYAVAFDEASAGADIERAKQVADCVIVSMHWGEEYVTDPTDDQKRQAQWLADQGVDLVVGSHAHVIQPVEYYDGVSGNRMPVVFGLGDFISGWTLTDNILSGIFTCDFVRQDDGRVSVENPRWHPVIEWSDGTGDVYVRLLENMGVDQINANVRTEDWPGSSFERVYALTNEVVTQIPVEWGSDAEDKARQAGGESASDDGSSSSGDGDGADAGSTTSRFSASSGSSAASSDDEGVGGTEISLVYGGGSADDDASGEDTYADDEAYYGDGVDYSADGYDDGSYDYAYDEDAAYYDEEL